MKKIHANKAGSGGKRSRLMAIGFLAVLLTALWHASDVLSGAVNSGDLWLYRDYFVLAVATLALLLCLGFGFLPHFGGVAIETIYLAAVAGFGFLYLFVLPPLSAPDEVSHYISAYQLSSRILGADSNAPGGYVLVREEDWFLEDMDGAYRYQITGDGYLTVDADGTKGARVLGQTLTEETYRVIHQKGIWTGSLGSTEGNGTAVSVYPPVITTPLVYVPQALGIALARVLGMGSLGLLYLGRMLNLLCFAGLSYLAMRRLPFGKEVLFGVCLLPMSLHLAASLSYDAMIMAGLFLFAALCLSLFCEREAVGWKDVLMLAAIMAAVGPCKMVYAVFMGLYLLIPVKKFGGFRKWMLSAAIILGAWAAMMFLINSQTIAHYAAETDSYIPWAKEAGFSLAQLLHNPYLLLRMFYNTAVWQTQYYHLTMVGAYLGNVDAVLDVPYFAVIFFTCGLLGLAFRKPGENLVLTGRRRLWILFLTAACIAALLLSMLIAWTPASSPVISGVQGRYFLPFLPLLLMTVKNDLIVLTKNVDRSILYLMCCANSYVLLRLFSIVCLRQ